MLKKTLNKLLKQSPKILAAVGLFMLGAFLVLEAPQYHANYIRDKVGAKTLLISNKEQTGGGTGFYVEAPSGKTYILTNAHICTGLKGQPYANVNGRQVKLTIVEVSSTTDLCLLDGVGNASGLQLASSLETGEIMGLVGHPALMPLTLIKGELIGYMDIMMPVPGSWCDPAKNSVGGPWTIEEVEVMAGIKIPFCVGKIAQAGQTTLVALGGNSGSACVNFFGNVVGVLFASRGDGSNWGLVVSLSDIKAFLAPY
jgi:S1-C subfamily serine protease